MCHKTATKVCPSSSPHVIVFIEKRQDTTPTEKAASQLEACVGSTYNHVLRSKTLHEHYSLSLGVLNVGLYCTPVRYVDVKAAP